MQNNSNNNFVGKSDIFHVGLRMRPILLQRILTGFGVPTDETLGCET